MAALKLSLTPIFISICICEMIKESCLIDMRFRHFPTDANHEENVDFTLAVI